VQCTHSRCTVYSTLAGVDVLSVDVPVARARARGGRSVPPGSWAARTAVLSPRTPGGRGGSAGTPTHPQTGSPAAAGQRLHKFKIGLSY
jgi:hypothetical protein